MGKWMPFAEAVARAGTFKALRPHLLAGRIIARYGRLCFWPGGEVDNTLPTTDIDPSWWADDVAHDIKPEAGRAQFITDLGNQLARGIELDRAEVDALWPAATVPAPRHSGGKDPEHDWEGAADHVDACVKKHGPLPRNKKGEPVLARAVELMTEWFVKKDPPAPKERSIRRWIRETPRSWWGPN
jgi:hypothetical protein